MGGMLFSLGIFAIKVGFGLGFSEIRWKGILLTLSIYLVLFVFLSVLSDRLIQLLEPVLRKGPYLHTAMAIGMIVWGIYLVRKSGSAKGLTINSKLKTQDSKSLLITRHSSLLLLVPCPVCLSAMMFSIWSALNVFKVSPALVGLGLAIAFILLVLTVHFSLKLIAINSSLISQNIGLGLSMIAIGFYFIASLFIPAKIEEAKAVYHSFASNSINISFEHTIGVLLLLSTASIMGFLSNKKLELKNEHTCRF